MKGNCYVCHTLQNFSAGVFFGDSCNAVFQTLHNAKTPFSLSYTFMSVLVTSLFEGHSGVRKLCFLQKV